MRYSKIREIFLLPFDDERKPETANSKRTVELTKKNEVHKKEACGSQKPHFFENEI